MVLLSAHSHAKNYMQSFIKIGVLVLEKSEYEIMTSCNFNKDLGSAEKDMYCSTYVAKWYS